MQLPYVIDNQNHKLADVLNAVMATHPGLSLDVASAYFSVSGYRALREQIAGLRSFRLLLGFQPVEAKDVGLRPSATFSLPFRRPAILPA
jgi:predicted solute-binding protein